MKTKVAWFSGLALLAIVLGRLCVFTEPFGISVDESNYLALAEILRNGGTAYVESIDRKPPGLFWFFEAHAALFGDWNIHAVHISFMAITFILGLIASLISGSWWALLLYGVFSSAFPREIISSNAEYLMLLPSVIACWILIGSVQKDLRVPQFCLFFGTLVAGVATLFKQYAALIYAPVYLAWAFNYIRCSEDALSTKLIYQIKSAVSSSLGLGLVYFSTYLYFWQKGAAQEFLYYSFFNGLEFIAQDSAELNKDTSFWFSVFGMAAAWLPLWLVVGDRLRSERGYEIRLYLWALLGACLTAFLSGRYYTHYFVPPIWFLCLLAAPQVERYFRTWPKKKLVPAVAFGLLSFIVFAIFNFDRDQFTKKWSFTKDRQYQLSVASEWVRQNSESEDRILVWGMASQVYPMAQRGSASGFVFADFVSGRLPGFKSAVAIPVDGAMERYIDDIQKNRPRFFINTATAQINDYGFFPLSRFPELLEILQRDYARLGQLNSVEIWQRK